MIIIEGIDLDLKGSMLIKSHNLLNYDLYVCPRIKLSCVQVIVTQFVTKVQNM